MSRFRFVFAVTCFMTILITAVYLRGVNNRVFYRFCTLRAEQSRLEQSLGSKQLRVESIINPAAVSERLGQ